MSRFGAITKGAARAGAASLKKVPGRFERQGHYSTESWAKMGVANHPGTIKSAGQARKAGKVARKNMASGKVKGPTLIGPHSPMPTPKAKSSYIKGYSRAQAFGQTDKKNYLGYGAYKRNTGITHGPTQGKTIVTNRYEPNQAVHHVPTGAQPGRATIKISPSTHKFDSQHSFLHGSKA